MENNGQEQTAKIKLTGLWKKTASNGNIYLAGPLSGSSMLMIFPNTRKNGEKDPDYLCYLYPRQKRDQSEGGGGGDSFSQGQPAIANQQYQPPAPQQQPPMYPPGGQQQASPMYPPAQPQQPQAPQQPEPAGMDEIPF